MQLGIGLLQKCPPPESIHSKDGKEEEGGNAGGGGKSWRAVGVGEDEPASGQQEEEGVRQRDAPTPIPRF